MSSQCSWLDSSLCRPVPRSYPSLGSHVAKIDVTWLIWVMRPTGRGAQPTSMKVVNYAAYASAPWRVAALRPAHREYLAWLHADGRLVACGPFTDGSGGLFIYDARNYSHQPSRHCRIPRRPARKRKPDLYWLICSQKKKS